MTEFLIIIVLVVSLQMIFAYLMCRRQNYVSAAITVQVTEQMAKQTKLIAELLVAETKQLQIELRHAYELSEHALQERISQGQLTSQQLINNTIQQQMIDLREQITHSFTLHSTSLTAHLRSITEELRNYLQNLTKQVNQQLNAGFEKTSSTFTDVVKRLAIIDEAQKKITELSKNVVNLQDVLIDKRARGAFGEVQLATLIANMIPSTHYRLQYTLSNQKRADCILFLPKPTGNIVIDAKFPLETYQMLANNTNLGQERKVLQQQFRQDLQKHIKDIAEKYIIANETTDAAVMFIPAEAIFAEIHANYPEIIALSHRLRVWLVSPSTLMAVLTTARAVLKDDATRQQVHIIQQHLQVLAADFQRFDKRMNKLAKHIDLAHQDVGEVSTSAKKITQRFQKIEAVEIEQPELIC